MVARHRALALASGMARLAQDGRGGKVTIGRPPRSESTAKRRTLRVTDAEWALWQKAARAADKNVSEWLREIANKDAEWIPHAEALAGKHKRVRK